MKFATDLGYHWGITTNGMLIDDEIIEKSHDEFRSVKGCAHLLKGKDCAKCENWKYCRGDSLHTWDKKQK